MSTQLNTNLSLVAPKPLDERYYSLRGNGTLPYSGASEVCSTVDVNYRYIGLTVNVNNEEWWFGNDTATLIKKESGGGTITGATNGICVSGKNVALGGGNAVYSGGTIKYDIHPTFTEDTQLIDKKYADMVSVGVHPKLAVEVATTGDIALTGLIAIDGITVTTGMRVLVKNQIDQTQNGIYSASTGSWGRTNDFDFSPTGETLQGTLIPVVSGTTNLNSLWVLVTPDPVMSGDNIVFTRFSSPTLAAGTGINIAGNIISLDGTAQAVRLGAITGATSGIISNGRIVSLDPTIQTTINSALTGATNGLNVSGKNVVLGGTLTGNTTIETGTAVLKLGTAGKNIVIDSSGILIGECTMASNYIYTDPSETVIDSGAGDLCICSNNIIVCGNNLNYDTHPTFTLDTQLVDKKYVDDRSSGSSVYNCASPATVTLGGITNGTVLTGRPLEDILQQLLVVYQAPAFSAFNIGLVSPVEVGTQISGTQTFTWGFSNSSNVQSNTMCVRDVTAGTSLATNISTTSPQSISITSKTFASHGDSQLWCGSAKNSCNVQFGSGTASIVSYYPYYWGKCTCPGAAGANRPAATCSMVIGGNKVLANSSGTISITFNSTSDDYLWFAIPSIISDKVCWCTPSAPTNNGGIGGGISPACNLFPAPVSVSVSTACWNNVNYKVYISNAQTGVVIPMAIC